jgi:hypothetical protein
MGGFIGCVELDTPFETGIAREVDAESESAGISVVDLQVIRVNGSHIGCFDAFRHISFLLPELTLRLLTSFDFTISLYD